jgi:uncharacterized SAM-binding protein YcdF (DUF218 family)
MRKKIYTVAGIVASILFVVRLPRPMPAEKEKLKHDSVMPSVPWLDQALAFVFLILFLGGGLVFLWIGVQGIRSLVDEKRTATLLEEKGEIQAVPLVGIEDHGRNGYIVRYQFNDSIREQRVSFFTYQQLRDKETVEIIAAGDTSKIAGTSGNSALVVCGTVVVWVLGLGITLYILVWYRAWRRNHPIHREKRKRGFVEM